MSIRGEKNLRFREDDDAMYDQEHRDLFAAIRAGTPLNDGERMASSTLLGIMARVAAYTGQKITWEQILKSEEDLAPEQSLKWDSAFTPNATPVPGVYKFV